eukprot:scaffold27917_cov15-Tisochrysis_lutea.AAC.1
MRPTYASGPQPSSALSAGRGTQPRYVPGVAHPIAMYPTAPAIAGNEPGTGKPRAALVPQSAAASAASTASSPSRKASCWAAPEATGAQAGQPRAEASKSSAPAASCQKREGSR